MRFTRRYLLALLLLLTIGLSAPVTAQDSDPERALATLNALRAESELPPLALNDDLSAIAQEIAETFVAEGSANTDIRAIISASGFVGNGFNVTTENGSPDLETYLAEEALQANPSFVEGEFTAGGFGYAAYDDNRDVFYVWVLSNPNQCGAEQAGADADFQAAHAEEFLEALNAGRAELDLEPLTLNTDGLYAAALWYSEDMLAHGYPTLRDDGQAHIGTDDSTAMERVEREGYAAQVVRENILRQSVFDAEHAYTGWFNSPGHYANMMADDVTEMALAFTCDPATSLFYYTQVLARPRAAAGETDDLQARSTTILTAINQARIEADTEPLQPTDELTAFLDELGRVVAAEGEFPDDLWDVLRDEQGVTGRASIYSFSNSGDAAASAEQIINRGAVLAEDWVTIGLGSAYDESSGLYYHIILLLENAFE